MNDFKNHQYWNVPDYIGEFNDFANGIDAWQFQPTDSGFLKVVSRGAPAEAWYATNFGTGNGTPIQIWQFGGGRNQQWQPVSLGDRNLKFVGRASSRCVDVPSASTANGVHLQLYDCNGTGAQSWRLVQQP